MAKPVVYVPIVGPDMETALCDIGDALRLDIVSGVEIRGDLIRSIDISRLMCAAKVLIPAKKAIFTNLRVSEGGKFGGSDDEWLDVYRRVVSLPSQRLPDYISVGAGYFHLIGEEKDASGITPIRHYSHSGNLAGLEAALKKDFPSGICADITRIEAVAESFGDAYRMLKLLDMAKAFGRKAAVIPMGEYGTWASAVACSLGSEFTLASLSPSKESAPGQMTVYCLEDALRMMNIYRKEQV